jgi:hypothetical protein
VTSLITLNCVSKPKVVPISLFSAMVTTGLPLGYLMFKIKPRLPGLLPDDLPDLLPDDLPGLSGDAPNVIENDYQRYNALQLPSC